MESGLPPRSSTPSALLAWCYNGTRYYKPASSIPSIVHSVVVDGGNGVKFTPRSSTPSAMLAWCYDGTRYYKPATNAAA